MYDIDEVQKQAGEWSKRNFPDAKPYQALLGLCEEKGELCHAHLKAEQGIRGSPEQHIEAKKDAIGDIIIYLMHYCTLSGFKLSECIDMAWAEVNTRNWVDFPKTGRPS